MHDPDFEVITADFFVVRPLLQGLSRLPGFTSYRVAFPYGFSIDCADGKKKCRSCDERFVPSTMRQFIPDGSDPTLGRCSWCVVKQVQENNTDEPHAIPWGHPVKVCNAYGELSERCGYLVNVGGIFHCGMCSRLEKSIRHDLRKGTRKGTQNKCAGHPSFSKPKK